MQNKKIILASASPRRRELLAQAGYEFEIQVSHKDEVYISETPDEIVKELALLKAKDIAEQNDAKNLLVVGADTDIYFFFVTDLNLKLVPCLCQKFTASR